MHVSEITTNELNGNNGASSPLAETYALIDKTITTVLRADYSSILLESSGQLQRVFASSPIIAKTGVRKNGRTYYVFHEGDPFFTDIQSKRDINPQQYPLHIKSLVFIPLFYEEEIIGVLNVFSRTYHKLTQKDLLMLKSFGALAGLSIRNAQVTDEQKKMVDVRDMLFAAASHELKTPATTIKLYGQMLERTIALGKMPTIEQVSVLVKEIERITKLVNQFLLFNRIRTGYLTFDFQPHHIQEVIEYSLLEFKANHEHQVIFRNGLWRQDDTLLLDFNKFLEAIGNILDNAAKHSSITAPIIVSLTQADAHYKITIQDKGDGIKERDLDKIFSVFVKGTSNLKEGMGMGLYLTKQIIEGHKGSISIQSKLHAGTTITILLPEEQTHESP